MPISRERAALMGEETRRILVERRYTNGAGTVVELGPLLDHALAGTRSYPAEHVLLAERRGAHQTALVVRGAFAEVVFAVLDGSPERRFIRPFEQAFPG